LIAVFNLVNLVKVSFCYQSLIAPPVPHVSTVCSFPVKGQAWAFIGAFTLSQSQIIISFLLNLQNVLESAPSGYKASLMGLPGQFQKPAVMAVRIGHIVGFGGVLERFRYGAPESVYSALNAW
jgi:hypothetical protein